MCLIFRISNLVIFCAVSASEENFLFKNHLELSGPNMSRLTNDILSPYKKLVQDLSLISLFNLEEIEEDCLRSISLIRSLYIWNAPKLKRLPKALFDSEHKYMKSIRIMNTGLTEPPNMDALTNAGLVLHIVDLEGNKIKILPTRGIRVRTEQLILDDNDVTEIQDYAFDGSELAELSLKGNKNLRVLNDLSFAGIIGIRELDVSSTSIIKLPTIGLNTLEVLLIQDNIHMKTIPSIYDLKNLRRAYLTHHFHCCAFQHPDLHDPQRHAQYLEYQEKLKQLCSRENHTNIAKVKRSIPGTNKSSNGSLVDLMIPWSSETIMETEENWRDDDGQYSDVGQTWIDEDIGFFHQGEVAVNANFQIAFCGNMSEGMPPVQCWPRADALNPCSGVLGSTTAHVIGWLVGVIGSAANLFVIIVLMGRVSSGPARLIHLQLALADFCTSGYLLLLASVDSYSSGTYFNFAYDWQYGAGCLVAGFFGVAGAQGSLLALAALTLERWLAITQALHPNRRLSPRAVRGLLIASIIYSFLIAALPFAGLSDYSSTSVCVPMRQRNIGDNFYLWVLLLGGILSVIAVAACYIHIYVTLSRDSRQCASKNVEASVAHKMAILIVTHMVCVLPIGAVAAGALSGWPLVDVNGAKILLVLVYPLNALADPFLYAILTHQFRRDLCILLARFGLCTMQAQRYKVPGANRAQLLNTKDEREMQRNGTNCVGQIRSTTRSMTTAYEELPV